MDNLSLIQEWVSRHVVESHNGVVFEVTRTESRSNVFETTETRVKLRFYKDPTWKPNPKLWKFFQKEIDRVQNPSVSLSEAAMLWSDLRTAIKTYWWDCKPCLKQDIPVEELKIWRLFPENERLMIVSMTGWSTEQALFDSQFLDIELVTTRPILVSIDTEM